MTIYVGRRQFVAAFGGAAVVWPITARAQQSQDRPRIGVLWHAGSEEEEAIYLGALRQGFASLGYVEFKNIILENRYAGEQYERFNSLAAELVRLNVDVLVAVTRPAALAAQRATTTLPIVFILVPDPVESKLVKSLARPGGNITGLSQMALDLMSKRVELLKETVPGLSNVVVLVNPADPGDARRFIDEAEAAAKSAGLSIQSVKAQTPEELDDAFSPVVQDRSTALIITNDPMFFNERRHIAELAKIRRLPVIAFSRAMARDGALVSFGPDVPGIFRRAAAYVDKILKGAKPADLPVELPTRFELIFNVKTAKALGLTVPPLMLARADEVIE